jgi:hypothetical protein
MKPAARSIKDELGNAVVDGIRRYGGDAVGLFLIGVTRVIVGAAALGVLLASSAIADYDLTAAHFAGLTVVAALINWVAAGNSRTKGRQARN